MTETTAVNITIGGDSKTVIAWANRGKADRPNKLYVGDLTVGYDKVDPAALKPIQSDEKYIFFALTLTDDGSIPDAPPPAPAKTEEAPKADEETVVEKAVEEALNPAAA